MASSLGRTTSRTFNLESLQPENVQQGPGGKGLFSMRQRDMSAPLQEWVVQVDAQDDGERIDRLLARRLSFHSRTKLQTLLQQGRVKSYSNWQRIGDATPRLRPSHRVSAGQLVAVTLDAPFLEGQHETKLGELSDAEILFEDEHLIAINKPSGCAVHPTKRHPRDSLVERLHRRSKRLDQDSLPTPCHRLDRETSGVIVFAKTGASRTAFGHMFEHNPSPNGRCIEKTYQAIVTGCPEPGERLIDLAVGPDPSSGIPIRQQAFKATPDAGSLQAAKTLWRLLDARSDLQRSLVELKPLTGRQHQLRVHAKAIGYPILGDCLYQSDAALFLRSLDDTLTASDHKLLQSPRLALHASELCFPHPIEQTPIVIEAPFPIELEELMTSRGKEAKAKPQ